MPNPEYSVNPAAERIMGHRDLKGAVPFDEPCELGFKCPVCEYPHNVDGNFDERLHWSEYAGFLWCSKCNFDYPSALCMPDKKRATGIFLETVQEAISRHSAANSAELKKLRTAIDNIQSELRTGMTAIGTITNIRRIVVNARSEDKQP